MPQMKPLYWLFTFTMVILSLVALISFFYFSVLPPFPVITPLQTPTTSTSWTWKW